MMKYNFATCPNLNYLCSSLTCYLHFGLLSTIDFRFLSFKTIDEQKQKVNSLSCHDILKNVWRMAFVASLHLRTTGLLLVTDQTQSQEDPLHICGSDPLLSPSPGRNVVHFWCGFGRKMHAHTEHLRWVAQGESPRDAGHPDSQTYRVLWSALLTTTCCRTYPETVSSPSS